MAEEAAGRRLEVRTQAADLHSELAAADFEDAALLVKLRHIDRVAGLQGLEVDAVTEVLLADDARAGFLGGFIEAAAGFLHGLLARVDALVVKLLLERFDDFFRLATHEGRTFLPRLLDEIALFLVERGFLGVDFLFE